MAVARFRFYDGLTAFLAPQHRNAQFEYRCARAATVKNAIEALGVPHTEVELIRVNGRAVDLTYRVQDGDRIDVFPSVDGADLESLPRLRIPPPAPIRFIADSQLGALARLLRMLGFDTAYDNGYADDEIRCRATQEERIILTRDRELLKCRTVTHGCYVHALEPRAQLREIVQRLRLAASMRPFTRCVHCNVPLVPVAKAVVLGQLPLMVAGRHHEFQTCAGCGRVYWKGTHRERMRALLDELLPENVAAGAATDPACGRPASPAFTRAPRSD